MGSITIKDVAQKAGVSVSTVSRVLNGYSNVNEETRLLVQQAIEDLGYRPNELAKGLRSQKTNTLGLVVNNILNPIYSIMAQAIESVAIQNGFNLFLCNSGLDPKQEALYLETLWNKRIDGLFISPTGTNIQMLQKFLDANIPVVQIDRKIESLKADAVLTNNEMSSFQAVEHLIQRGYRKIAIIVGMQTVTTGVNRLKGYFEALTHHDIPIESAYVKIGDFTEASGYKLMSELAAMDDAPEAVFVGNNLMAKGAVMFLREAKLRIPDDIGFMMFDNPDWSELYSPPITVVHQPYDEIALKAAGLMMRRIADGGRAKQYETIVLDNQIVVRQSLRS
jgi:LacI family transcriptional regulator